MEVWSIIQKSQLEGAHRMDAEYYQPEYRNNEKVISSFDHRTLGEISMIAYGTTPANASFVDRGIPFVRSQNLSLLTVDESALVFCDEEFHQGNEKSAIRPKDILFAAVGATIGQLAIVQSSLEEGNINQNIARVRITLEEVNPIFVGLFFASRIGQLQISRLVTGNAQAYLNTGQIKSFRIPIISQNKQLEIAKYFDGVQNEITAANFLYSQAENLLLEKLGLKDFKLQEDLSCVVNLSDIKSAHRADAEYFQPKYGKLISKIKMQDAKLLPDIIENVPAKFNPAAQQGVSFKYVELADINSSIGVIDSFSEVLGKEAPSRAKRILKKGDVIVSSVEGSLKKVALVDNEQNGYLASTGFFQFRSKEILPEVLLVLAKSLVLQIQLRQQCAGTILTAVPKEAIKNILIPILPKSTQQKIADLVCKSYEARKKAKELLEEAKQKVEKMISGDS